MTLQPKNKIRNENLKRQTKKKSKHFFAQSRNQKQIAQTAFHALMLNWYQQTENISSAKETDASSYRPNNISEQDVTFHHKRIFKIKQTKSRMNT